MAAGRPGPAAVMPLEDIRSEHAGAKVRVAGCLASYDETTSLGCLAYKRTALIVDLTACVRGLRLVDKPMLMIIGDLEAFEPSQIPAALDTIANPIEDLVLRAHLVRRCDGLDFQVWDQAARKESAARWQEQQQQQS